MHYRRHTVFASSAVVIAMLAGSPTGLWADEESEAEAADDSEDVMEEIVVHAYKPGDRIDLDVKYENLWRSRLMKDLDRQRDLEEEMQWRSMWDDDDSTSRIRWGYNPSDELRMRRETDLTDLPIDDVKPATLLRLKF